MFCCWKKNNDLPKRTSSKKFDGIELGSDDDDDDDDDVPLPPDIALAISQDINERSESPISDDGNARLGILVGEGIANTPSKSNTTVVTNTPSSITPRTKTIVNNNVMLNNEKYGNHTALGVANLNVSEVLHFMPPDEDEAFHAIEGTPYYVHCQWISCMPDARTLYSIDGDVLVEDMGLYNYETLDDPKTQLINQPWCYRFTIDRLTGAAATDVALPFSCQSAYCTYTFQGCEYRTETVLNNTDNQPLIFNYSKIHRVANVDMEFIHAMQTKSCRVWVFVREEKDVAAAIAAEKKNVLQSDVEDMQEDLGAAVEEHAVVDIDVVIEKEKREEEEKGEKKEEEEGEPKQRRQRRPSVQDRVLDIERRESKQQVLSVVNSVASPETDNTLLLQEAKEDSVSVETEPTPPVTKCISCGIDKPKNEYSSNQWKKKRQQNKAKCKICSAVK